MSCCFSPVHSKWIHWIETLISHHHATYLCQLDLCSAFLQYSLLICYYLNSIINQLWIESFTSVTHFSMLHRVVVTNFPYSFISLILLYWVVSILSSFCWWHFIFFIFTCLSIHSSFTLSFYTQNFLLSTLDCCTNWTDFRLWTLH